MRFDIDVAQHQLCGRAPRARPVVRGRGLCRCLGFRSLQGPVRRPNGTMPRRMDAARGARGRHRAHPARDARHGRHLPASVDPRDRGRHRGPRVERARRVRDRRCCVRTGASRARDRLPLRRRAHRAARGGGAGPSAAHDHRRRVLRRGVLPLDHASYRPRPVQRPHPPIWIGGSGNRLLRIVGRYADAWHGLGEPTEFTRKSRLLDAAAEEAGRDPASIFRAASLSLSSPWDDVRGTIEALADAGAGCLIVELAERGPGPARGVHRRSPPRLSRLRRTRLPIYDWRHDPRLALQLGRGPPGTTARSVLPGRPALATSIYLAVSLGKPLLLEGEAGVGKTEVAKALSTTLDRNLIRLQCYEGIDASQALYEWDYSRQLIAVRAMQADDLADPRRVSDLFGEEFLVERPLLAAIRAGDRAVLLVDELDRADDEFEAFLLEVLSEFAVTDPRAGADRVAPSAGGRDHVEPHARAARRAEAPLPVPLDRPPDARARGRDHRRARAARSPPPWRSRSPAPWPGCARWRSPSAPASPRRSTGRTRWRSWASTAWTRGGGRDPRAPC